MSDEIRTAAVFKVVQIKRPTSGEVYAEQMVLAVPNQGRYCRIIHDYVQSFAKKWRISESAPYPPGGITEEIQSRWLGRQETWHKVRPIGAA